MTRLLATAIALSALLPAVSAQYYCPYCTSADDNDNGVSYGVRIAIGVAVAVGVGLVIVLVGFLIRKRRAKAFKAAYPVQQQGPYTPYGQQQQPGADGNQASYPPYTGAGYQPQPSYAQSPPYQNYGAGANGYNPQYASTPQSPYPPPPGAPPQQTDGSNQGYFSPPPGPPPNTSGPKA